MNCECIQDSANILYEVRMKKSYVSSENLVCFGEYLIIFKCANNLLAYNKQFDVTVEEQ